MSDIRAMFLHQVCTQGHLLVWSDIANVLLALELQRDGYVDMKSCGVYQYPFLLSNGDLKVEEWEAYKVTPTQAGLEYDEKHRGDR